MWIVPCLFTFTLFIHLNTTTTCMVTLLRTALELQLQLENSLWTVYPRQCININYFLTYLWLTFAMTHPPPCHILLEHFSSLQPLTFFVFYFCLALKAPLLCLPQPVIPSGTPPLEVQILLHSGHLSSFFMLLPLLVRSVRSVQHVPLLAICLIPLGAHLMMPIIRTTMRMMQTKLCPWQLHPLRKIIKHGWKEIKKKTSKRTLSYLFLSNNSFQGHNKLPLLIFLFRVALQPYYTWQHFLNLWYYSISTGGPSRYCGSGSGHPSRVSLLSKITQTRCQPRTVGILCGSLKDTGEDRAGWGGSSLCW